MLQPRISSLLRVSAFALLCAGCTTLPTSPDAVHLSQDEEAARAAAGWDSIPAVRREPVNGKAVFVASQSLPANIASRIVTIPNNRRMSVADFSSLLNVIDVPAIPLDEKTAETKIFIPAYHGPLGALLKSIEKAGLAFEWQDGVITITTGHRYIVRLPQDEVIVKNVSAELSALGATEIAASQGSGVVSFTVPPIRAPIVNDYLNRSVNNASMIGLQVAVITVSLDRKVNTGIDWSKFQAVIGPTGFFPGGPGAGDGDGSGGDGNDDGSGSPIPNPIDSALRGQAVGVANQAVSLRLSRGDFNLQMFLNMLSQYGNTRTTQNLILRTLSGAPVKIRSGESIPYVSGVGVSTLGGDSGGFSNGLLGSASIDKAESGLTLEIKPSFDASAELVTLGVQLDLSSILGFVNLSAGAQVGQLTQPNIQEQSFNNVARLKAGETVVLGGLVFDYYSDSRNTLAGLEKVPVGSKDESRKKSALIVVIRPTVTTYDYAAN